MYVWFVSDHRLIDPENPPDHIFDPLGKLSAILTRHAHKRQNLFKKDWLHCSLEFCSCKLKVYVSFTIRGVYWVPPIASETCLASFDLPAFPNQ